jgi:hypothetical protein
MHNIIMYIIHKILVSFTCNGVLIIEVCVDSLHRHDVSITVTSISSRERPRARGAGAPPISGGGSQSSSPPKSHARIGSDSMQQQSQQQYNNAYSARSTPMQQQASYIRGDPGDGGMVQSHLNTPSALYRNSRSLDSGLDEFGAVPFAVSPPSPQTRPVHAAAQTQTQPTQVRKESKQYVVFLLMMMCR